MHYLILPGPLNMLVLLDFLQWKQHAIFPLLYRLVRKVASIDLTKHGKTTWVGPQRGGLRLLYEVTM